MGVYVANRKQEIVTISNGAVDQSQEIASPATVLRVHITFASTPASEDMTIKLLDSDSNVIATHVFDPSAVDPATLEVTRAFADGTWTLQNDGGEINVTFANTGNTVSKIAFVWEQI